MRVIRNLKNNASSASKQPAAGRRVLLACMRRRGRRASSFENRNHFRYGKRYRQGRNSSPDISYHVGGACRAEEGEALQLGSASNVEGLGGKGKHDTTLNTLSQTRENITTNASTLQPRPFTTHVSDVSR